MQMRGKKGKIRAEKIERRKNAEVLRLGFWRKEYPFSEGSLSPAAPYAPDGRGRKRGSRGGAGGPAGAGAGAGIDGRRSARTGRLLEPLPLRAAFLYFCHFIKRGQPGGRYRFRPPSLYGRHPNADPGGYGPVMRLAGACLGTPIARRPLAEKAGYDLSKVENANTFNSRLAHALRRGWVVKDPGDGRKGSTRYATSPLARRYLQRVARG